MTNRAAPKVIEVTIDAEGLISPCLCRFPPHLPVCRLEVLLARMERPRDLFRNIKVS